MTIKASNYPTVRPTLDLNFAQTKRLDPRVTFSRGSTGTYFDANGVLQSAATNTARFDHNPATGESLGLLVEESRANLATYSEHFDNAAWTKTNIAVTPNSALAPDNTFTADLIAGNGASGNHWLFNNTNDSSAGTRTYSIYAKANTHNFIQVLFSGDGGPYANFNLSTGVVGNTGTSTTASIQAVGNGWYRCIVYTSSASATTPYVALVSSATAIRAESNSLSTSVYLWAAQSEFSATFPTSYIPTPATFTSRASSATYYDASGVIQTAGTNVARSAAFFPDSNGVMRPAGLLLEAASTNLLTYSEQFDNAAWTKTNATITANAAVAPDGTTTAEKLASSTGTWATYIHQTFGGSGTRTLSVFAKASDSSWLAMGGIGAANELAYFNLSTGTVGTKQVNVANAVIEKLPNGWYRCSVTCNFQSYGGFIPVSGDNTLNIAPIGQGIFIWGAQLEASPYAASYIPTTTATVTRAADVSSSATVTRSADVASMTGTNFSNWYNQSEGTLFAQGSARGSTENGGTNSFLANLAVTSSHVFADLLDNGSSFRMSVFNGTTSLYSATPSTSGAGYGSTRKAALAMKPGNYGSSFNGVAQAGGTSSLPVPAFDRLNIGYYAFYNYMRINSTISRLTYWPTRLSDATLQAITL